MTIQNGLALVADIGGTNARFALCEHDKLLTDTIKVLPCKEYDNLDSAVTAYLKSQNAPVDEACMAFACPVSSGRINMTNNHWNFDRSNMQQKLGLKTFKVINDFTAQALALPALCGSELVKIGGGEAIEDAANSARTSMCRSLLTALLSAPPFPALLPCSSLPAVWSATSFFPPPEEPFLCR